MSQPRVLLVEDEPWLAELQAASLTKAGYAVEYAAHAQAAMGRIDEATPAVIVLDMMLTGATGMALLHELQSHEDLRHIPVVLCTSASDAMALDEVRPYGVRRILDKTTMQPDDIVVAVRSVTA